MADTIMRQATLAAHEAAFSTVLLASTGAASRFVLRGGDALAPALAEICALPPQINRASQDGGVAALKLGPDEYLLVADEGRADEASTAALAGRIEQALGAVPHSLVDVSHRQTGILVSGRFAADILSCFCPLDLALEAFPVGMATRTIFEKCEIVLWRREAETFHVEVWRSFAPYVLSLLETARRE